MRARRIFLWSGVAFLGVMVVAGTWLWTADLGVFKSHLEQFVSDKTGRRFVISGEFSVKLGRETVVIADGIRFKNPEWADAPEMVEIGHFELRLKTSSLLKGPVEIEFVGLNDADIRLVRRAAGEPNWALPVAKSEATSEANVTGPAFLVREIEFNAVRLVYESPERTGPLDFRVLRLHQQHRADDTLEITLAGTLNDREVRLQGSAGTWDALLEHRNIEYELVGQFDTLSVSSKGVIDDLADLRRPTLEFAIRSPDVNDVARLLRIAEGGTGDIDLTGSLTAADDSSPMTLALAGRVGQSAVDAVGLVSDLRDIENGSIRLRASGPDLSRILRLFGVESVPDAPFSIEVDLEKQDALLTVERAHLSFANAEFDLRGQLPKFPGLNGGEAHLTIAGPDFEHFRKLMKLPGNAKGAFGLDFDLEVSPEGVDIVQLRAETSLGRAEAAGHLGDAPDYIGSDVRFRIEGPSLARLTEAYGLGKMPDAPVSVSGAALITAEGIRTREPLTIKLDRVKASIDGLIAMQPGLVGSDLTFGLEGPDLAKLVGSFAAVDEVPAEPYDLRGRLQIQSKGYRFRDTGGTLGRSTLTFSGLLQPKQGFSGTEISFDARGPALEELVDRIEDFRPQPGPYSLSADAAIKVNTIELKNVELERPRGKIRLDLILGRSDAGPRAKFNVRASGQDFRSILARVAGIEFYEAPFTISSSGELGAQQLSLARLDILVGDMTVAAQGDLSFGDKQPSTRFSMSARVPSLAKLGLFDGARFIDQRFELDGTVGSGGRTFTIEGLRALLGESELRGFVRYTNTDIPELEIDVQSDLVVISPWLEEDEVAVAEAPGNADGRVIPDVAIPFDAMKKVNAIVKLEIGELRRNAFIFRSIAMQADLRDGDLHLHSARLQGLSGWMQAKADVESREGTGRTKLEVTAREVRIGTPGSKDRFGGVASLDLALEAGGTDLRTLAGNANGVIFLDIYDGQSANQEFLNMLFGDVLNEIVSTINPFSKTESVTRFDCVIFPLDISDGLLTSTPSSFIRTDKIQVVSALTLNFKDEQITANIRTSPRKGMSISAGQILNPFIKVVGTLAAPRLAVDEQGVIVTGGVAVATGGLSILAKAAWDRLSRSADPCDDVRQEAAKVFSGRLPEFSSQNLK